MITQPFDLNFLTAVLSKPGTRYDHNEDAYRLDERHGLFLIADGMGGHRAGEVASSISIETLHRYLIKSAPDQPEKAIGDAILEAHREIRQAAEQEERYRGMGTTVLVCWILLDTSTLWVGHVGNSRAYLFRQGRLKRLTEDHTMRNEILRAAGAEAIPSDRLPPPNVLSQALGRGAVIAPQIIHHDVQSNDRILLCTDGVSDILTDEELAHLLQKGDQLDETCEQIAQAVEGKGAPDNFTVILVEILPGATSRQKTLAAQKEVTP